MSTNLRAPSSPLRNEFHTLPVLGEWLDILIFLCYLSIPVQLVLLLLKPPVVMDHRKLTSTFSNIELFRTRLLLLYFAMFIIFCGLGHGINAMCSATTDESVWCFLVVPGKMVIALTSGATSVMLLLWMPSLTSWLRAIEIHRKGFTEVVVNELSHSNELADVTFGSVMHVQELANHIEQLQADLAALRAEQQGGGSSMESNGRWNMSALTKFWRSQTSVGEGSHTSSGYHRVAPQVVGAQAVEMAQKKGFAPSSSSSSTLRHEPAPPVVPEMMFISFVGPSWVTCGQSATFRELIGTCGSLQEFSNMCIEGRFLMGQAHAAMGALHRSKGWRKSLVFEVTFVPPHETNREYRADCAVKATRKSENGKDLEVLHIWLWGLGTQMPRDQRPKVKQTSRDCSYAGSTMSRSLEEDQGSSRVRTSVGSDVQRKQRERLAFASVQRKLPDLEDMVVQYGRSWRAEEMRQRHSESGEATFRQAVSRLDIARLCLGLPPVLQRLHFERKESYTEVYDVRDVARSQPLDILAGQGLDSWLWALRDEPERLPMRGVALVAQQATHIYQSVDTCTPLRPCNIGEEVIASGPPQEAKGVVLVPIEKEGVVQVGHFAVSVQADSGPRQHGGRLHPTQDAALPRLPEHSNESAEQAARLNAAAGPPRSLGNAEQDEGRSSDSSGDQEDEQLNFRLGLMS